MKKEFRDTGQAQSMMFWGNCALAIEHQPVHWQYGTGET